MLGPPISKNQKIRVAIVGLGVSGLTAAYLLDKHYALTLYERNAYLGGHTNTIVVKDGPDQGTPVDTGFIVYNDRNYPTFIALLDLLQVKGRDSDMSFGFSREEDGFAYSSYVPNGLFASRRNLISPSFYRMINDILCFNRKAREDLKENRLSGKTLGEYLAEGKYSSSFTEHYLIPMGAAIWSTPFKQMFDFPAETFLRFFNNHGLLALKDRPNWKSISGGSHSYIKKMMEKFCGKVVLQSKIEKIVRKNDEVTIYQNDGSKESYDYVILGTHADESLRLLDSPTSDEERLLGAWTYHENETVLHTDKSVMPKNKRAWASWNYTLERGGGDRKVSLTYDMNRLQGLQTQHRYFVTLNREQSIPEEKVIRRIQYTHPCYDFDSVRTQRELQKLNGPTRIFFCGSYFTYGFHEDAVKSAVAVTKHFGVDL